VKVGRPALVQHYLRFAGVVGTPRVQGFRARTIRWRELHARSMEATYTNGSHTIRAVLGTRPRWS